MSFVARERVVTAGEGEVADALGSRYVFKLLGQDTAGAFSLVEETLLDDEGPPLHVHAHEEEVFYVLEGRGLFVAGGTERELGQGDLVVVPRGVPHTLAPRGRTRLRMLVIVSPAGLEHFFVDVATRERDGTVLAEDDVVALAAEYGTQIVGPPLSA